MSSLWHLLMINVCMYTSCLFYGYDMSGRETTIKLCDANCTCTVTLTKDTTEIIPLYTKTVV